MDRAEIIQIAKIACHRHEIQRNKKISYIRMRLYYSMYFIVALLVPSVAPFCTFKAIFHRSKSVQQQPCFAASTSHQGPLSMDIDQLADAIGGSGRALIAWDCFRIGVDPVLLFNPQVPDWLIDSSVLSLLDLNTPTPTSRRDIQQHMPLRRATQTLGKKTLDQLSQLYSPSSSMISPEANIDKAIATLQQIQISADGTTKLLIRLAFDGALIESVIIPVFPSNSPSFTSSSHYVSSSTPRSTLCVSSQVGCRQACTFCATGRMGKLRDLTADEILIQLFFAKKIVRVFHTLGKDAPVPPLPHVDNIVFMGMGEPSDNSHAVLQAASIMTHQRLFGLAQSKVTISTVAPTPLAFTRLGQAPAILAWSVHAVRDSLRRQLVPTTQYSMVDLRQGLVDALNRRPTKLQTTMWEITLIEKVNDSKLEAEELAQFALEMIRLVPRIKLIINLIPFNDIGHGTYRKPSWERIRDFQNILIGHGLVTFIRTTRGDDESAACGQLATKKKMMASS